MERQILQIDHAEWRIGNPDNTWTTALEAGKVLYFPRLAFAPTQDEQRFFTLLTRLTGRTLI